MNFKNVGLQGHAHIQSKGQDRDMAASHSMLLAMHANYAEPKIHRSPTLLF